MGTRADFYVGKGKDAEWLGSIPWDGYPAMKDQPCGIAIERDNEEHYRQGVEHLIADAKGTTPDMGWPWPWEDSVMTDFAYTWDDDRPWVSHFGGQWVPLEQWVDHDPEADEDEEYAEFPNMKHIQNVTFGPRSGLIVIGIDPDAI